MQQLLVVSSPVRVASFCLLVIGLPIGNAYGANHLISADISAIDCQSFRGGISAGDVITIEGGSRGPLRILNCVGTSEKPIIIRNDPTLAQVVISRSSASSGGFVFEVRDSEHFIIDGTGGYRDSNAHCGSSEGKPGTNCGLKITRKVAGDAPTGFLKFSGLHRNYTVRGLHIDGRYYGTTPLSGGGSGNGIQQHDRGLRMSDHPGYWHENILYEQNYIQNTNQECMYIGANWDSSSPNIPLRNITVQDNFAHDCGRNAITIKSAVDGENVVRRNYAARTGLQRHDAGRGGILGYTSTRLALYQNVVIESGGQCFGINSATVPSGYSGGYFYAKNNVGVRCGLISHPDLGYGVSARSSEGYATLNDIRIEYNTIVDSEAHGVRISGALRGSDVFVQNNIITTPKSGSATDGPGTHRNNLTSDKHSVQFARPEADDYSLTAAGPALNSGTLPAPDVDVRGTPRPQGDAPDQGAFEFSSSEAILPKPPTVPRVQ